MPYLQLQTRQSQKKWYRLAQTGAVEKRIGTPEGGWLAIKHGHDATGRGHRLEQYYLGLHNTLCVQAARLSKHEAFRYLAQNHMADRRRWHGFNPMAERRRMDGQETLNRYSESKHLTVRRWLVLHVGVSVLIKGRRQLLCANHLAYCDVQQFQRLCIGRSDIG